VGRGQCLTRARFFDRQYAAHERYWWQVENRYSTDLAGADYDLVLMNSSFRVSP
jgi:hypothetical protein